MAKAATKDSVSAAMKPIDYRGCVQRLGTIDAKKSKQQKIAKEIGDVFSAGETIHGVDKDAMKIYMKIRGLSPEDRLTTFRDLNGLLDAGGILTEDADLVDVASGNVVSMRLPAKEDPDAGNVEEEVDIGEDGELVDEGDDFTEASEEELAQQTGRAEAKEKKAAPKKAADKKEEPEPYTGDNSDLADSGD